MKQKTVTSRIIISLILLALFQFAVIQPQTSAAHLARAPFGSNDFTPLQSANTTATISSNSTQTSGANSTATSNSTTPTPVSNAQVNSTLESEINSLNQSVNLATWLAGGALIAAIFALIAALAVGQRQKFPPEPAVSLGAKPSTPPAGPAIATGTQATQVANKPLPPAPAPRPTSGGTQQPVTRPAQTPSQQIQATKQVQNEPRIQPPPTQQAQPTPTTTVSPGGEPKQSKEESNKPARLTPNQPASQETAESTPSETQSQQQSPAGTPAKSQYKPHAWGEKVKE